VSFSSQKSLLILFVLILIGFGARILFLSAPSLWLDEAISANVVKGSMVECIRHAKTDLHPPLYYLLLHRWSLLGHDEFMLRLFSVIANFLSGFVLFLCARKMFNARIALLTLLFFTLSPFQIRYSQEVRMYSLLGLWMVLALFFMWKYLESKNGPSLLGYVLSSALGLYTHYQAGIFLIILNMVVIIRLCYTEKRLLLHWFLAQTVILALFAPWIPNFIDQFRGGGRSWVSFHPSFPLFVSPLLAFLWGDPVLSRLYHFLGPIFWRSGGLSPVIQWSAKLSLGIILISTILMAWKKRKQWVRLSWPVLFLVFLLLGTLGLSYGLSFKSTIYGAKYLFGTSFIFYILVVLLLTALSRFHRKLGIGLGIIVMIIQFLMLVIYYQPDNYRENWRGAVAYIRDHSEPHHAVGFHFDRPMAPYVYYSDDSVPAFGFLEGGQLSPSLSTVTNGQCEVIWLFDYLAELYDLKGRVIRELAGHGYIPTWHHSFNGVPLTMWRKTFPPNEKNRGRWGQSDPQDPG
jgi:uncharacterized membrane protein